MKLLVDFGNSRCKWALLNGRARSEPQSYRYTFKTAAQSIEKLLQLMPVQAPAEMHAVSVLGESFNREFSCRLKHAAGIDSKFHAAQSLAFGVRLAYSRPAMYGADRYAALIAAHTLYQGAKIILDCGTATTVDAIDARGRHMGGLIMPGVNLMARMLAQKTANIELPEDKGSIKLLCSTTQDAVWSGSVLSLRYGLAGMIKDIQHMLDENALVLVTGGEKSLLDLTREQYIIRPDLVLEGLQILQG